MCRKVLLRRALRWVLAALAVVVVLTAWASSASAEPGRADRATGPTEDPDEVISDEVRCLKSVDAVVPDNAVEVGAEQLIPPYQMVQGARRLGWMLGYLGVPVGSFDVMRLTEEVPVRGPRWYVAEAEREAEDHRNCSLARSEPLGTCTAIRARISPEPPRWGRGGQEVPPNWRPPPEPDVPGRDGLTGLLPDKCWGRYPASAYDIHYDDGGFFSWDRKIWVAMTGTIHTVGKAAIQIGLGMIGIAFGTFHVLDYQDIALMASSRYQSHLVGPFGLAEIAYFVLFAFVAIKALTGKLGIAGGEIVMSLLLATLASTLMANQQGYLEGSADTMDKLTSAILAAGNGHNPSDNYNTLAAIRPVQEALFVEFVDAPFDYIHFGGRLSDDSADEKTCLDRRNRILEANVQSDGGWAIRYMRNGGDDTAEETCEKYADSMGNPSGQKMFTAFLVAVVCIGVALIVGGAAITMVVAKILLLVLFALAPFAAVAAILPGLGRRLAWGWVGTLLQAFLAAGGMAFVLSLFLLGIQGVTKQTEGLGPFERWFVLLVIVAVVMLLRSKIVAQSQRLAGSVGDHLTRLSPAAAHWQGGGTGGLDLNTTDRSLGRGLKATVGYGMQQAPLLGLAVAGGVVGTTASAYGRRKTGKIGIRNLRNMELDKRMVDGDPIPNWHSFRKASKLARAFGTKGGKKGGGGGGGLGGLPVGKGGGPGGRPFVFNPRGPRLNFNAPGGPQLMRPPSIAARMRGAVGNWARPRMDGAAQKLRLDQAKHATVTGWDKVGAAAKGRWHKVEDRLDRRWENRQASLPNVHKPKWVAAYGAQRREIYQRYAARKSEIRTEARAAGVRVNPQQIRDLHSSYRQELRDHKQVWNANRGDVFARRRPPGGGGGPPPPRPGRDGLGPPPGGGPMTPPPSPRAPTPPRRPPGGGGPGGPGAAAAPGEGKPLSRYGDVEKQWTSRGIPTVPRGDGSRSERQPPSSPRGGRGASGGSRTPPSSGRGGPGVAPPYPGDRLVAGGGKEPPARPPTGFNRPGNPSQGRTQRAGFPHHDEPSARPPKQPGPFGFNRPGNPSQGRSQPAGFPGARGQRVPEDMRSKVQGGFYPGPPRPAPPARSGKEVQAGFRNGPPRPKDAAPDMNPVAVPGFYPGAPKPHPPESQGAGVRYRSGRGEKGSYERAAGPVPPLAPTPPRRTAAPARRVTGTNHEVSLSVAEGSSGSGGGRVASDRAQGPKPSPSYVGRHRRPGPPDQGQGARTGTMPGNPVAARSDSYPVTRPARSREWPDEVQPSSLQSRWFDEQGSPRREDRNLPEMDRPIRPSRRPDVSHRPTVGSREKHDAAKGVRAAELERVRERAERSGSDADRRRMEQVQRSHESEDMTAAVAARYGFRTEQFPERVPKHHRVVRGAEERFVRRPDGQLERQVVRQGRDPDLRIEGKFFDNKLVSATKAKDALKRARRSLEARQAEGVILDLSFNRSVTIPGLLAELRRSPVTGEVWVRRGEVLVPVWPADPAPRSPKRT